MSKLIDLTGKTYYELTVLYRDGYNTVGRFTWKCKCSCGKETYATSNQLKTGRKKSCGCARKILPSGEGSFNWLYGHYKRQAKLHKRQFDLSKELFKEITSSNCVYCGRTPQSLMSYRSMNGEYRYNGIDRVDSSKGYVKDNVVPCCDVCNKAKNNQSVDEFYSWIERVYLTIHPHFDLADAFMESHKR